MSDDKNTIIQYLTEFITPQRQKLFHKVLNHRTRYITVALEDIYQSQNASAVLRTCDCLGVQDVHIIENRNEYQLNPNVVMGASKWLDLKKYNSLENNTLDTINKLKSKGYRIVATTPHTDDINLNDFNVEKGKFALLFGTELNGLSDIALQNADEFLKISLYGFTESFNISVSAGIVLHHLVNKLHLSSNIQWRISENEKNQLLYNWLKKSIKSSDLIEQEFYEKRCPI